MGTIKYTDKANTIIDAYRYYAEKKSDKTAYTYQNYRRSDVVEEDRITFGDLDRKARSFAAYLNDRGVRGERVILLFNVGLRYVEAYFSCLYAGAIPVPAYPPNASRFFAQRLHSMIPDSQVKFVLTTSDVKNIICSKFNEFITNYNLIWITIDTIEGDYSHYWMMPPISKHSIAFLQYTSGSTSTPKGVIVTHRNLVHNIELIIGCFQSLLSEGDENLNGVIWLPPYHDMGLIGGMLALPYCGLTVNLMSPFAFMQRPYRWLEAISRFGSGISAAPNFAFDYCVKNITEDQKQTLNLSKWRIVFNGAEPINPTTLEKFSKAFVTCGFRKKTFFPCFGLAESSLIVSGGDIKALPIVKVFDKSRLEENTVVECVCCIENARTIVGCGTKLDDGEIRIVNPYTSIECKSNTVGEIWLKGPSVAKGYWNKSEITKNTFQARIVNSGEGPFLRTGDLGFIYEGELFITGRLKDLIIINGRNINPNDIENYIETLNPMFNMHGNAVFSVESDGEEVLVIMQEVCWKEFTIGAITQVKREISKAVKEMFDLDVYDIVFIKQGSIKKTSSGKIKRKACKEDYLKNEILGVIK
jgi:acyl-CoA synthetase (AMP-forming)/AMP-acid ligase II